MRDRCEMICRSPTLNSVTSVTHFWFVASASKWRFSRFRQRRLARPGKYPFVLRTLQISDARRSGYLRLSAIAHTTVSIAPLTCSESGCYRPSNPSNFKQRYRGLALLLRQRTSSTNRTAPRKPELISQSNLRGAVQRRRLFLFRFARILSPPDLNLRLLFQQKCCRSPRLQGHSWGCQRRAKQCQ